jgi:hypothetical protein
VAINGAGAPVATYNNTSGTTAGTGSYVNAISSGSTSCTAVVGNSGILEVTVSAAMFPGSSGAIGQIFVSFALSGANTLAASDNNAVIYGAGTTSTGIYSGSSRTTLLTGLTPGSTVITVWFKTGSGNTATITNNGVSGKPF